MQMQAAMAALANGNAKVVDVRSLAGQAPGTTTRTPTLDRHAYQRQVDLG